MTTYAGRLAAEREHYNRFRRLAGTQPLRMSVANIQRYCAPARSTVYPLEFAYHLLGAVHDATVLELGCGAGLNTVVLAALGANVIAVDISEENLALTRARLRANDLSSRVQLLHSDACALPLADESADKVFGIALLHHVDSQAAAHEVRRVLKPEGTAVFSEPIAKPAIIALAKRFVAKADEETPDERPLTLEQVEGVTRAIGTIEDCREFGLISRLVERVASERWAVLARRLDGWLLRAMPEVRQLASPFVWSVSKDKALAHVAEER